MAESNPHILVVDDELAIREPLARYLKENGFRVTQADGSADARSKLSAYAIDLVVLDIMMPGEDGLSLCRHIRANSDVPVILLTARTEDTERIIGLEMGRMTMSPSPSTRASWWPASAWSCAAWAEASCASVLPNFRAMPLRTGS